MKNDKTANIDSKKYANQSFQRTAWASASLQPTPPLNSSFANTSFLFIGK
jgi:hypothetical protein